VRGSVPSFIDMMRVRFETESLQDICEDRAGYLGLDACSRTNKIMVLGNLQFPLDFKVKKTRIYMLK
jgi:hypothetical protein